MAKLHAFSVPPQHAPDVLRACFRAGNAALLLDPTLTDAAKRHHATRFGASSLHVIDPDGSARTTAFDDGVIMADDTALVVLTSGSTGEPKGVELTHAALDAAVTASLARLALDRADTVVQALPTHHVAGLLGVLRAGRLQATLRTVTTVQALQDVTGDLTALVPTQLARLVENGSDLRRLGTILLGGAAAPPALLQNARERGATIVTSYGMSETCGGCVYDGIPLRHIDVAVDAPVGTPGPIRLRGPQLFRGYRHGRTLEERSANDWFHTADEGVLTAGKLTVVGRSDQVAISGGENVPLAAVTQALIALDDVRDAYVFSRPDDLWGDAVHAVVATGRDAAELRLALRDVLPAHWIPRQIRTVEMVPRTGLGKPDFGAACALFERP
jgi:o-succinylbenzoate---CoA ligase